VLDLKHIDQLYKGYITNSLYICISYSFHLLYRKVQQYSYSKTGLA